MRLVIRSEDARAARDAQTSLSAAGVQSQALAGGYRAAPDGEDIAIFPSPDANAALAHAAQTLNAASRPLAALLALPAAAPLPDGLDCPPPFLGAIALDAPPKLLAAQLGAYLRVAALEAELARRLATAAALGLPALSPGPTRRLNALYVGAPSAMFLQLERAFAGHGGSVAAAFSSFAGFDHLHNEVFDAVVLNGVQKSQTAITLCAALRRNAALYHLPTMLIAAPDDANSCEAAIERGASAVAFDKAPCGASLGWLFEAIRRDRRRARTEHDLRTLRDLMGDTRTGLFLQAAFEKHLARLGADHHASGRPLALAALRVLPAHGAREPPEGVWRKGFDEIASIAARLMRESDSGAAVGRDLIVLALPGADLAGAKRTAERIASVAECTAFAAGDGGAVPLIFEQAAVELQPGESGVGLMVRALGMIEAESIPA